MEASDIMTDTVYFVEPDQTVSTIRKLFIQHKISRVPVVDNGDIVGVVTDRDMSDALYHIHDPIDAIPASKIMRKDVTVVRPNHSPEAVAKIMNEMKTGEATVFDKQNNSVLGIITKKDLTRYFTENYAGKKTVADLMHSDVITIGRFHSIFRAAKEMEENNIAKLVVIDGGPVGILTARDLALATYGLRPEKLQYLSKDGQRTVHFKPMIVDDLMRQELFTIPSKSDAVSAAKLMLDKKIGSVVVVDNKKLMGIITKTDFVRYLAETA